MKQIPTCTTLTTLEQFILSNNQIKTIPDLSDFKNLKIFFIEDNMVDSIEKNGLSSLEKLEHFNCSFNNLTEIPLLSNKSLKSLNVSFNQIDDVFQPNNWQDFDELQDVNLQNNPFKIFDGRLFSAKNINRVMASHSPINDIQNIPSNSSIEKICFTKCELSYIPPQFFRYKKLNWLSLANNYINSIPDNINHTSIEYLDLSHNNLNFLPQDIGYNEFLTYLLLSHNKFTQFPTIVALNIIPDHKTFEIIDLSFNFISSIPTDPLKHVTVNKLFLNNNLLTNVENLPANIPLISLAYNKILGNFSHLNCSSYLDLSYNALSGTDIEIVGGGFVDLKQNTGLKIDTSNLIPAKPTNYYTDNTTSSYKCSSFYYTSFVTPIETATYRVELDPSSVDYLTCECSGKIFSNFFLQKSNHLPIKTVFGESRLINANLVRTIF